MYLFNIFEFMYIFEFMHFLFLNMYLLFFNSYNYLNSCIYLLLFRDMSFAISILRHNDIHI